MQGVKSSRGRRAGALLAALVMVGIPLEACGSRSPADADGQSATEVDPETGEYVDCLGNATESPNATDLTSLDSSGKPDEACDQKTTPVAERPCAEIWRPGEKLPVPYYGCDPADGAVPQNVAEVCQDPAFDTTWVLNDLMAREGGPVVRSTFQTGSDGHVVC